MFSKKIYILLLPLLFVLSCKDDEPVFPVEPAITLTGISPSSATEYADNVVITIQYEDGDGDLGENTDGVKNCFVTDNRVGVTYQYRISQLAPTSSNIHIKGDLNIDLGGQSITDNSTSQSANYTLYVVDRAGHKSNSVTTGNITIHE